MNNPLGRGVSGEVALFVDPKTHRKFAIKYSKNNKLLKEAMLHFDLYNKLPSSCKQFISKPFKPTKAMIASLPGYYIHAMEYIDGAELKSYLISKQFSKKVKMCLIKQLRKIILCLWKNGFIHADLHLHNVMVVKTKTKINKLNIKLIDFGHSKKVVPLRKVSEKKRWFQNQWDLYLNEQKYPVGNPNIVVFGTKLPMYAKTHKKIINNII